MDANLYSFELLDPDLDVKFNLNFEKIENLKILKKNLLSQISNFFPPEEQLLKSVRYLYKVHKSWMVSHILLEWRFAQKINL